jgi:hypothetical protein
VDPAKNLFFGRSVCHRRCHPARKNATICATERSFDTGFLWGPNTLFLIIYEIHGGACTAARTKFGWKQLNSGGHRYSHQLPFRRSHGAGNRRNHPMARIPRRRCRLLEVVTARRIHDFLWCGWPVQGPDAERTTSESPVAGIRVSPSKNGH